MCSKKLDEHKYMADLIHKNDNNQITQIFN